MDQVVSFGFVDVCHGWRKANIYLSKKEEGGRTNPVMPGYMPVFYFRTCDVTGKMLNMKSSDGNDVQMAMPGLR